MSSQWPRPECYNPGSRLIRCCAVFFASGPEKIDKLIDKGRFKRAMKKLLKACRKNHSDLSLARRCFEVGQFIPFDKHYHQAANHYFTLALQQGVSGEQLHDDYMVYTTTTQGRIDLPEDLLLKLAANFAAHGHENSAVFLVKNIMNKSPENPQLPEAILALVNAYLTRGQIKKAKPYVDHVNAYFLGHDLMAYINQQYRRALKLKSS